VLLPLLQAALWQQQCCVAVTSYMRWCGPYPTLPYLHFCCLGLCHHLDVVLDELVQHALRLLC